jgi:hypothetical protein
MPSIGRSPLCASAARFQIQAYPFRLTPANLAHHRTNPNMAFWKMLKEGNDHFEATHLEPKVEVCNRHYVFDPQPSNSSKPIAFNPTGKCPDFVVNPKIARPAGEKQHADEVEYAQLVKANVSVAPIYSGLDGGMNKVFLAQFPGNIIPLARVLTTGSRLPQLPPVPWADNDGSLASKLFGALFGSKPATQAQVASTDSATQERAADSATTGSTATPTAKPAPQIEAVAAAKPVSSEPRKNESAKKEAPKNDAPESEPQQTAALQPRSAPQQGANAAPPTASDNTISAPPIVPADSFDYRWGGLQ